MNQACVAPFFPFLTPFLSLHLSRFSFYIYRKNQPFKDDVCTVIDENGLWESKDDKYYKTKYK